MVNLDGLYVNADVSEAYLIKVKKGDIVNLEFPSLPDIKMEIPVYRTGNIVKSANRTFTVQLKINTPVSFSVCFKHSFVLKLLTYKKPNVFYQSHVFNCYFCNFL